MRVNKTFRGPEGNLTGGSGNFADANSDECDSQVDTELISPPFDASPYDAIRVDFLYNYKTFMGNDTANMDIYNGTSWNTLWTAPDNTSGSAIVGSTNSAADNRVRFHYDDAFDEYYWQVDKVSITGVTCSPVADGGLVVGNVYDLETGDGMNGATVTSGHYVTDTATTRAAPDDPAVDDGFYILFSSLAGDRSLEASAAGYTVNIQTPIIVTSGVTTQNFSLAPKRHVYFFPLIYK